MQRGIDRAKKRENMRLTCTDSRLFGKGRRNQNTMQIPLMITLWIKLNHFQESRPLGMKADWCGELILPIAIPETMEISQSASQGFMLCQPQVFSSQPGIKPAIPISYHAPSNNFPCGIYISTLLCIYEGPFSLYLSDIVFGPEKDYQTVRRKRSLPVPPR